MQIHMKFKDVERHYSAFLSVSGHIRVKTVWLVNTIVKADSAWR